MPDTPVPTATPCGGCGATKERQRCIGCRHDFGTQQTTGVLGGVPGRLTADQMAERIAAIASKPVDDLVADLKRKGWPLALRAMILDAMAYKAALEAAHDRQD